MSANHYLIENCGKSLNSLQKEILRPLGIKPTINDVLLVTAMIEVFRAISFQKFDLPDKTECLFRSLDIHSSYSSQYLMPYITIANESWNDNISSVLNLFSHFAIMISGDVDNPSNVEIKKFIKTIYHINDPSDEISINFRILVNTLLKHWKIAEYIHDISQEKIVIHNSALIFKRADTYYDTVTKYQNSKKNYLEKLLSHGFIGQEGETCMLILASLYVQFQQIKNEFLFG